MPAAPGYGGAQREDEKTAHACGYTVPMIRTVLCTPA
jgi:hypothetical protein